MLGIKPETSFETSGFSHDFMEIDKSHLNLDFQADEIFDELFAFFGTLSPDGFVLTLKGKVFERTLTDPELLSGQKFSETAYWQSSEFISTQLDNAIAEAASGKSSKTVLDFRVNAEEKMVVELFLNPIGKGENSQIFFCALDVTAREKEVQFYKQRSDHLLYAAENADIGLWFWDLVEDKIYSTPKCNELFEVPVHEAITLLSIADLLHPEDAEQVEAALRESQTNGTDYNSEFRVIYSDGSIHWITARGKTYLDAEGNPQSMMGVVRGITEKKIESEELSKIYAREKKARDEAEEANRTKDQFLAIVSHELRSPLNAILGWTKILLTKEVDNETRQNALETIERSARSQAKLIEDLVDSARIASGKMRLEFRPTNLYEIIKTIYNSQKPLAEAKNIQIEFTSDNTAIPVFGDMVRLQQVFSNILSNSIKFTPEGGNVSIDVHSNAQNVSVQIKDNGQGISPESLPNIFRQFSQGDEKTSRDRSGLGLGLSISKILVEKHNGTINAESAGLGSGATFSVELPLSVEEEDTGEDLQETNPSGEKLLKNIKILIVEDDSDSRQVLQLVLEQSGARVECAESAQEAVKLLARTKKELPDVIVSDLAMPVEDGYSLMSRIRRFPAENGGKIPAIALSAFATNENKQKAFRCGFQRYHTKPFEPDMLIEDILDVIKE